jgi:DNA (cytosine-5)-methyltransferase 1
MLKVRTLFSGIGSPESALKNLGIEFELVDFCEIDKYAVKSYCAIHGANESKNLGDISKVWGRNLPYADMLVWGFPCADISVAGKQKGIIEGETRSGLYYEGLRILKETKPKYSIIENVKNLTGKKFKEQFKQMLEDIDEIGYNNYWQILNAKNYGIPQNRERVFIVSIRKDIDLGFEFPKGFDNGLRLKDMLEDEVDEKFYISNEKVEKLIKSTFAQEKKRIQETDTYGCLLARDYKNPKCVCIPCITPGRVEKRQNGRRFKEDDDPSFTLTSQDRHGILQVGMLDIKGNEQVRRVYDGNGLSPTLNTMAGGNRQPKVIVKEATKLGCAGTLETSCTTGYYIRKLTPKECFRLMGFSDEEFQRCVDVGVSNSQLYKQAGNSIVTNVLYHIFNNLLPKVVLE